MGLWITKSIIEDIIFVRIHTLVHIYTYIFEIEVCGNPFTGIVSISNIDILFLQKM